MKVWVTRHALTTGIYEAEVLPPTHGVVEVKNEHTNFKTQYLRFGIECFLDRRAALDNANIMRAAKIESLQRQIDRLKGVVFT